MRTRFALVVGLALALGAALAPAAGAEPDRRLQALGYLPADSIVAGSVRFGCLSDAYDAFLGMARQFVPAGEEDALSRAVADWEARSGVKLRDDLLARLCNEGAFAVAVDDLDRFALTLAAAPSTPQRDAGKVLGGALVFALGVKEPDAFEASLRKTVASFGGAVAEAEDGVRTISAPSEEGDLALLRYRYHRGSALFGFTSEALAAAVQRAESGTALAAAPDFVAVFAHLAPDPDAAFYLNLPRVQELLRRSALVQAAAAAKPEAQRIYQAIVGEKDWRAGIGWTSYDLPDGSVQQAFMPVSLGELYTGYLGFLAGIAGPNFASAAEAGKQKRTMADLRTIGTALEAYAVDHNRYPPNVPEPKPVAGAGGSGIEALLVPTYMASLPAKDGWGNPILYQSNREGTFYTLTSLGRDGKPTPGSDGATRDPASDIVFRNGNFVAWPGAE